MYLVLSAIICTFVYFLIVRRNVKHARSDVVYVMLTARHVTFHVQIAEKTFTILLVSFSPIGPRLSSLGLSFFKIIYFFYCVLGSCTLYTLYKTIFILLYSIKNYLQSAALFFIFGVPKGTRTSIARLGGGCSILLSYKHISSYQRYYNSFFHFCKWVLDISDII